MRTGKNTQAPLRDAQWKALPSGALAQFSFDPQRLKRPLQPVKRTNCSASILVPKIDTLGIWPRAIATSSQR